MDSCEVYKKRFRYHIFIALTLCFLCLAVIFAIGAKVTDDDAVYIVSAILFISCLVTGGIMAVLAVRAEIAYIESRKVCCPKCRRNPNRDD